MGDCVVRFNAHGPFNCSDPGDGTDPKCPDTSDYGARDDIRFVNANPEMLDRLEKDPCVSSVGGADPTCKRVIVTWLDGSTHESQFFGTHATAEVADGLFHELGIGDLNEAIREYAFKYSQPKPAYVSSAFIAMNILKHPRMCGTLYAFGFETGDTPTRRITPSPRSTTTFWSTTTTRRRCATAGPDGRTSRWSGWKIRTGEEGM